MTKIVVGLGNPGDKYLHSRHNAGFIVLQQIVKVEWKEKRDWQALVHESSTSKDKVIYILPQTFMNNSGQAVQAVKSFYKVENSDITVIHDELDLPFGEIRAKQGGTGTTGHNGLRSVTSHIGVDYNRIRIGIRNELTDLVEAEKFVLSDFSKKEFEEVLGSVKTIEELLDED